MSDEYLPRRFLRCCRIGSTSNSTSIRVAEGLHWPQWPACRPWKVLVFVLIVVALSFCIHLLLGKLVGPVNRKLPVTPGMALFQEFLLALALLIATGIMAWFIDRKPFGYFGMPLRNAFHSSFWIGAAIGLGLLALQLEIMHLGEWFDYGTVQLHGGEIVRYGLATTSVGR